MTCRNYYKLADSDLEKAIDEIRWWLFNNRIHLGQPKAQFALQVALSARELRKQSKDDFIENVLDILIET